MAKLAEAFVEITAKTGKLEASLKKIRRDTQKSTDSMGDSVKKLGAIIGGAFVIRAIKNFTTESITAFAES